MNLQQRPEPDGAAGTPVLRKAASMPLRTASPIASSRAKGGFIEQLHRRQPARIVTGLAENVPPCGSAGLPDVGSNTAMNCFLPRPRRPESRRP